MKLYRTWMRRLGCLLLLGGIPGWAAGHEREPESPAEKLVVDEIRHFGGTVKLDEMRASRPVIGVYLDKTLVGDAWLMHLKKLPSLRSLNLGPRVTDAGLVHLKGMAQLEYLYLDSTQISDAGLQHLKGLDRLINLHVRSTQVTDGGVKKLKRALPNCKIKH